MEASAIQLLIHRTLKTFIVRALALLWLVLPAQATPLSGNRTIGPTGNYASITAAIADVQAAGNGLGGALVLELQAAYVSTVETFPLTIPALNGASAANTLTIRPASGATALSISSADITAATVNLNGAQFVTIDGRPGGTGSNAGSGGGAASQLTIANTNTLGVALRFINEASGNTIRYTTFRSVNFTTNSGTVFFGNTAGPNGNDNNTMDHCDIGDGASAPSCGIFSFNTSNATPAQKNGGNTVSNCNFFNFYAAGVRLEDGNTDWTISNNSFYQTASRAAVAGIVIPIDINQGGGNNYTVTGNFIGGSAPNAGGAAWTTTGTAVPSVFLGIRLLVGATTPSSVQGNTIANFVWTSSSPGPWGGILVRQGAVNVGTVTGNTVGSGSGTGSVSVTTSGDGAASVGISMNGTGTYAVATNTIANNTIGSITTSGADTSGNPSTAVSVSLTGIQVTNGQGGGTTTVINNTVGSTGTANSLNAATPSISATGQQVTGIVSYSYTGVNITGNTVANLNNNYAGTATSGQICGILTKNAVNIITGNTVRNLSTTSQNAGTAQSASVLGISQASTQAGQTYYSPLPGQTVSQNIVHSLANTSASAAASATGIYYTGPASGTNVIARNLVHSVAVSSTSATAVVNGMQFDAGAFTAQNNMVRVGVDATGNGTAGASGTVYGILDNGTTDGRSFCHNSAWLGGTQVSGTSNTFGFASTGVGNVRAVQNNIFVNARSNSGATGGHFAVIYGGSGVNPTGLTSGGNIFLASGTGGGLGVYAFRALTTLAAWQAATGQDANSAVADPLFIAPTGTAATVDLHLQASNPAEGGGVAIAAVTDDFDGQTRSAFTPADVGADAGGFTLSSDIFPPVISYPLLTDTLSLASRALTGFATITDKVGVSGGAKSPRLYFKKSTDAHVFNVPNDSTGNGWKYATAGNATSPYDFTVDYSLLNGGGVANGDTIQYFVVAQDEADNLISGPLGAGSFANPPVQIVSFKLGSVNSYRVGDIAAPAISYPLLTSGSTASRVLTGWATIADDVGVARGTTAPRLYYKKGTDADVFGVANNSTGNGWKYVTATGSGPYGFTLDYSLLHGGGVSVGDTIQYFVVAQDALNNLGSSPAGATASANPPVRNVNGHGAVNSFSIIPGISGTVTVGSGGTYPSLSGAGGLFAALNGAVLTGNLAVNITSDLTETGVVTLNELQRNGYPFNTSTLTIQPDSATMRTISGGVTAALITLNGADGVTMDGRFGGSGRYLTFRNTNASSLACTILFQNNACSNTVRNCVVEGASTGTLGVIGFSYGAVTGGNDHNLITGCQVRDLSTAAGVPTYLIASSGGVAVPNSGNTVSNNELFNFDNIGIYIDFIGNDSWTLSGNDIHEVNAATGVATGSTTGAAYGILLQGDGTNVITGNFIHDLLTTNGLSYGILSGSTYGATTIIARNRITALNVNAAMTAVFGIYTFGYGASTIHVVNNQITLSPAASTSTTLYGLLDFGDGVVNVFCNSVVLGGTDSGTRNSWASYRMGGSTHTARDNIFLNLRTGGSGSHFAAGSENTAGSYTVSHNVYAGTGATAANFMDFSGMGSAVPMSFATWQSLTGDTASQAGVAGSGNFTAAMFASAVTGDLHLVPGGNVLVNALGIPIAGVTDDCDGDPRLPNTPTIGSDEIFVPDIAVAQAGALADGGSVSFGTVTMGSSSAKTFTITNPGSADLTGLAVSGGTGEFSVSALSGATVPAGGGSVTFTVTFTPSAGGARSVAIHIASNVTGTKNPFDIALTGTVPTVFQVRDFNGDGMSDLVWENTDNGGRGIWFMNGATYAGSVGLGEVSTDWRIAGTGDFNGDGKPDIVWQNTVTGAVGIWFMNAGTYLGNAKLGIFSTDWQIAGTGDFNGDGQTDLVWQNTNSGERAIWFMNGATYAGFASLGVVPTDWQIAGLGDFNGDGQTDIVWQNTVNGGRGIWFMNGATYAGSAGLGAVSTDWQIAGTGDFNGDGQTDLLWQNTISGGRGIWLMNGSTFAGIADLGVVPTEWKIR
jgi:hypothetical protein